MKLLNRLAAILSIGLLVNSAWASEFPNKPLDMVIPYSAGGTSDILGRLVQGPLADNLNQPIVIHNKPGGGSVTGTSQVARAKPDGYTFLLADLAILVNPSLMPDLPYNTTEDFRAVTAFAKAPLVMLINGELPFNNLSELIEYAKENPGKLNYSSGGYGTSTHMAGELFLKSTGLDIVHVPYQGVAPAMNAILGGQVDIYFGGTTTGLPYLETGQLKALGITGDNRNTLIPDVPTFKELGIEGVNADTYWGVYIPAKTSDEAVKRINEAFSAAILDPTVQEKVQQFGIELQHNTPEEQQKLFKEMVEYWRNFVQEANIKIE